MKTFAELYADLESTWRGLAKAEGTIYVPNATPAGPVDYILVTMEPSMRGGRGSEDLVRDWIANSGRNFYASDIVDYILHWSVRCYLCSPGQTYQITDISKGAMLTREAKKDRRRRYDRWWPSLDQEIKLLSKPDGATKIVAIGNDPEKYLLGKGCPPDLKILHFGGNARGHRETAVKPHEEEFAKFAQAFTLDQIKQVAIQAMTEARIPEAMREAMLARLSAARLSDSDKKLAFIYRRAFEEFAKGQRQ